MDRLISKQDRVCEIVLKKSVYVIYLNPLISFHPSTLISKKFFMHARRGKKGTAATKSVKLPNCKQTFL